LENNGVYPFGIFKIKSLCSTEKKYWKKEKKESDVFHFSIPLRQ
jgi:hypothetical protein